MPTCGLLLVRFPVVVSARVCLAFLKRWLMWGVVVARHFSLVLFVAIWRLLCSVPLLITFLSSPVNLLMLTLFWMLMMGPLCPLRFCYRPLALVPAVSMLSPRVVSRGLFLVTVLVISRVLSRMAFLFLLPFLVLRGR